MSLINYVEPVSLATFGGLLFIAVVSYIVYLIGIKFVELINIVVDNAKRHAIIESAILSKFAAKKNINLEKELVKSKIVSEFDTFFGRRKISKRIEEELIKELFGDKETE